MEIDPQSQPQDQETKAERAERAEKIRRYVTRFFTTEYAIMQELEELRWRNALARKEGTERSDRESQFHRTAVAAKSKDGRAKYQVKQEADSVVLSVQAGETS